MDELREMSRVVSKNKIKQIPTLDRKYAEDRVYDFYERILNDQFRDDKEAAAFYFNVEGSTQYRKLKTKLRTRLQNTLFFIDTNNAKFSNAQQAFYQCQKDLTVIKLLQGRNAGKAAYIQCKRTLAQAKKFEFVEIVVELLKFLRGHYALNSGDFKAYKNICRELTRYEEIKLHEDRANAYYQDISLHLDKKIGADRESLRRAYVYLNELEEVGKKIKTFNLHMLKYWLELLVLSTENRLDLLLKSCSKAIRFFNAKPNFSKHFMGVFYYYKLLTLTKLGDYSAGSRIVTTCNKIFEEGTNLWYNTQELYFALCMHTRRYGKSGEILEVVYNTNQFKFQFEHRREAWALNEAYLYYVSLIGKLSVESGSRTGRFRVKKFLNDMPVYAGDKRGFNVPVLVVQILILIHNRSYDQLADRLEAIERYTTRYLKRDTNFRSNCFIKMLLQVPKRHFHRAAVIRHAESYYSKLIEESSTKSNEAFEMEIIPYEHLWEYILESLDNRFH